MEKEINLEKKISIISSPSAQKPYAVIFKPSGLPSAPLTSDDENNALVQALKIFPELKDVKGKKQIEYGLLHRIDNETSGILLIAQTQSFYDYMQKEQNDNRFVKYYYAFCDFDTNNSKKIAGFPENPYYLQKFNENQKLVIKSYFRHFGEKNKEVRPVTNNSNKAALNKLGKKILYETEVNIKKIEKETIVVECKISRGFKHQVRNHLAWIGLPIKNDFLYNAEFIKETEKDKKNAENQLRFSAAKIEFFYPKGDLNSYEIALSST